MKTGDLILFKGNGALSALIMAMPGCTHSHVAIAYKHEVHGMCIFESTSVGTEIDLITGELINGVQLTNAEFRMANYDGDVEIRRLNKPLTLERKALLRGTLQKLHGTPYEKDNMQLARAQLDIFPWHNNQPDPSSLFCSELVAIALRVSGVMLTKGEPANEFTPSDFNGEQHWINGYKYTGGDHGEETKAD